MVSVHFLEKKNDISSVRKHYCALGLRFGLEIGLGIELGLAEIRFWSNVFSSLCSRSLWNMACPESKICWGRNIEI